MARRHAVTAAKAEMDGPFMQKEDLEHYRNLLNTPQTETAAIVAGAAAVGCIILGPVALLMGAAAVGIGAGAVQILEEQRKNTMKSAQELAVNAGYAISHACLNTYRDSGNSEHVPTEVQSCCPGLDGEMVYVASVLTDVDQPKEGKQGEKEDD